MLDLYIEGREISMPLWEREVRANCNLMRESVDSDGKDSLRPSCFCKACVGNGACSPENPAKKRGLRTFPHGPSRWHITAHLPWSWGYWAIILYTTYLSDNRLHLLHLLKDSQCIFIFCLLINHDSLTVCKYASNWREKVRKAGLVWVCLGWGTPAQSRRNGPSRAVVSPLPLWRNPCATTLSKTDF